MICPPRPPSPPSGPPNAVSLLRKKCFIPAPPCPLRQKILIWSTKLVFCTINFLKVQRYLVQHEVNDECLAILFFNANKKKAGCCSLLPKANIGVYSARINLKIFPSFPEGPNNPETAR